jgi:hypothetical protein
MSNKKESQKVVRINDRGYIINAFKGRMGWSYLPRLTKYVFPFIGYMFNESVNEDDIVEQLMNILTGENAKEVEQLVFDMVEMIQVDGSNIDFDFEFEQSYDTLILLFIEVIKLNYFDSFQRLVTNLPKEL